MSTVQNLAGDSANVAKGSDPSSNHLLANTGTVNAVFSLNGATGIVNGATCDFGSSKKTISFQIVPAGVITAGAVTLQVSSDNVTWFTLPVASAQTPPDGLVTLGPTAAANPTTLATGVQQLMCTNIAIAVRYARANVSTAVTGTGASVAVQISAA
jgi:hypothetical protein